MHSDDVGEQARVLELQGHIDDAFALLEEGIKKKKTSSCPVITLRKKGIWNFDTIG